MGASTAVVDLRIGGMTCASCASRVEKKLNRIDGVAAAVNFATETARIEYGAAIGVADLISTVEATGYRASVVNPGAAVPAREGSAAARLAVAASLTVPLLLLVMVPAWQFAGSQWWVFALATPVVTWCAWPFHRAALANLRHGATTMDTLISLGAIVSYVWSVTALFTGGHLYFEVGAALVTFQLIGRYAEARAKRRAGSALRALLELGAKDAAVLRSGVEHRVPVGQLQVDDLFVVRPGERLATDGVVTEGTSAVDASMMTGESLPVEVTPGTAVVGGTVNVGGRLIVRATRVGSDTQLAQLARLVADAQSGKAPVQRLADRVAGVFVPAVLVAAVATFVGWVLAGGGANAALTSAVAVLIVACPCALGLATPMALLVGTGRGAALGIVIRGPQILETTRRIDTIVLDKTGTVTTGAMRVSAITTVDGDDACAVLRIAGALESAAEHPIARAIAAAAAETGVALPAVTDFVALPGLGARGTVDGHQVVVGRPRLLRDLGIDVPADSTDVGTTSVAIAWDGALRGRVTVSDDIRPTSPAAVADLRTLGLRPVLLTGDNTATAAAVAAAVGIDDVQAEVLPADKLAVISALQRDGRVVAMVGDGVNDAAALAAADLGIAMGSGTDAAIQASDLTLMRADLSAVGTAIRLSRATLRTIKGNLFWAFAYNVAAIPLAAAGLVTPLVAAAAMAASSLFVVANSLRLIRFAPHHS
ncbi:MAG TPA: heavy metal translocating P-type ATPase [Micromonosporaceae bacterium]|nr:heavy metal translocating P-type ATPase [Micromonosporaceae bacterium]